MTPLAALLIGFLAGVIVGALAVVALAFAYGKQ